MYFHWNPSGNLKFGQRELMANTVRTPSLSAVPRKPFAMCSNIAWLRTGLLLRLSCCLMLLLIVRYVNAFGMAVSGDSDRDEYTPKFYITLFHRTLMFWNAISSSCCAHEEATWLYCLHLSNTSMSPPFVLHNTSVQLPAPPYLC